MIQNPILAIFPSLSSYAFSKFDRRYKRNVMIVRNAIQTIMDDRRQGKRKSSFGDDGDLLGILLQS
jgi:hypothetical protein